MSEKEFRQSSFPPLGRSSPLVPPLYQSSVYTLPDLDAVDLIMDGEEDGFFYARDGHPNARSLAYKIADMEAADWGIMCSSGMAAISSLLISLVQPGDRIVASHRLYGKTAQLLREELSRFGVDAAFVDTCDLDAVREEFAAPAHVLLVETMSNPLLRIPDIPALVELCKEPKCALVVDNTFATPELCRPLVFGAFAVVESLTKMMTGHSDVTLGAVCGKGDFGGQVGAVTSTWGFASNPFDCWLAERNLATLQLRMEAACNNAAELAKWLVERPDVGGVSYPGLEDHPDHNLAGDMFEGRFGNMLCFELSGGRAAVNRFMRQAPEIPFSPSLGSITTTLSHPATTSHRYISATEKRRQGISDGLVRFSVGIENFELLKHHIAKGLK